MTFKELGWAGFGGIIVVLALIPSSSWVTKKVAKIEEESLEVKDTRYLFTPSFHNCFCVANQFALM